MKINLRIFLLLAIVIVIVIISYYRGYLLGAREIAIRETIINSFYSVTLARELHKGNIQKAIGLLDGNISAEQGKLKLFKESQLQPNKMPWILSMLEPSYSVIYTMDFGSVDDNLGKIEQYCKEYPKSLTRVKK